MVATQQYSTHQFFNQFRFAQVVRYYHPLISTNQFLTTWICATIIGYCYLTIFNLTDCFSNFGYCHWSIFLNQMCDWVQLPDNIQTHWFFHWLIVLNQMCDQVQLPNNIQTHWLFHRFWVVPPNIFQLINFLELFLRFWVLLPDIFHPINFFEPNVQSGAATQQYSTHWFSQPTDFIH